MRARIGQTVLFGKDELALASKKRMREYNGMRKTEQNVSSREKMKEIGARLRVARRFWRITQSAIGEAMRVDQSQYSRWERGKELPDVLRLMELADRYRVSMDFICYGLPVRVHPDIWTEAVRQSVQDSTVVVRPIGKADYMDMARASDTRILAG